MMSKWERVAVRNNWGHFEYTPVMCDGTDIEVRWPDGTTTTARVLAKSESYTVPDMGHSYEITRHRFGIETNIHGHTVWVDLSGLEIKYGE